MEFDFHLVALYAGTAINDRATFLAIMIGREKVYSQRYSRFDSW